MQTLICKGLFFSLIMMLFFSCHFLQASYRRKPLIIPRQTLNQHWSVLNGEHKDYCGYYALWAAYCSVKSDGCLQLQKMMMNREDFNKFLKQCESIIRNFRGHQKIGYLHFSEISLLIKKLLYEDIVKIFPALASCEDEIIELGAHLRTNSVEKKTLNLVSDKLKKIFSRASDYIALTKAIQFSCWHAIVTVDQGGENTYAIPYDIRSSKAMKGCVERFRFYKQPQALILLVDDHWICLTFCYQKGRPSLLTFDSCNGNAHLDPKYFKLCAGYFNFFVNSPLSW